jgi:hypothetical protein
MTRLARFRDLIGAYGADPRRWPPDERAEAEALLARSPEAAALQRTAAALDALLDKAPMPAAPRVEATTLADRVSLAPQEKSRPYLYLLRAQDKFWIRAVGLAAAAIIGFVVGTTQMADLGEPANSPAPIDVAEISPW